MIINIHSVMTINAQPVSFQSHEQFKSTSKPEVSLGYLLYGPENFPGRGRTRFPLLVFLHGIGERGNDLEMVKRNGLPKLIEEGKKFPFMVVSPQCPPGGFWDPEILHQLIQSLAGKYKIDGSRIYLTGLSMGGFGTWALAAAHPELFAAIIPICGGGFPYQACAIKEVPTWVFHGARDEVVPLIRSEEMVKALKKCGGNVKFTIYPESGHDSWTETYNNPVIYDWLLKQKKK